MTEIERVAVWDAINEYAAACGGDTSKATVGNRRMDAVVAVERVFDALRAKDVEVAHWAQAVLTALNVGDVPSECLLHKKLRQVMIAYRLGVKTFDGPGSTGEPHPYGVD